MYHEDPKIQEDHELAVLKLFTQWLASKGLPQYELVARPNPPDGILRAEPQHLWVEIADAYRSDDEAHEERSHVTPGETPFLHREHPIMSPDARTAEAVLREIKKKMTKESYYSAIEKYGPGVLICCERDPLFDQSTLQEILERIELEAEDLQILNKGVFKEVYLYQSPANGRAGTFHILCVFPGSGQ